MLKQPSSVNIQRTLGPVSDLERHLPVDWWKKLFNSLYLKTDGDVVENQNNTKAEVDYLIQNLGLKKESKILDLCCGQGRHALELASRGFLYVAGVDRSSYLIRLARKRALAQGLSIQFSEGDARKIRLGENTQDFVYLMGNSFGYFEREEDDRLVLESIKRILVSCGKIALDITNGSWMRNHFEPRSWEWIDENHFVCRERSLSADQTRIISREVIVNAEKGVIADQFYAERLYDEEQIQALFKKLHFENIQVHGTLIANSTRGHDLGMMANRIFITATAPVKKVSGKPAPKVNRDIVVILGDPRMPDQVKKGGVFNPEDMETINRLKEALNNLSFHGYRFTYLDNHTLLLNKLQAKTPSFIFNLCDEGYKNSAFKELHVPAFLEMLNIPYSGAGPASLGICYNKSIVRAIASSLDIAVPEETYYDPSDQAATIPSIFPAILKPNYGDSSIGITQDAIVSDAESLIAYIDRLRESMPGNPILIQEFLEGSEYSVGIIGNPGNYTVLPILEVDYSRLPQELPQILGYESKWLPESNYWRDISYRETKIDEDSKRKMIDASMKLFERTGCRDYARFDFRSDKDGNIKLLEVNPNPGWCWDGKFNLMASFAGYTYTDLLQMILQAGLERCGSLLEKDTRLSEESIAEKV